MDLEDMIDKHVTQTDDNGQYSNEDEYDRHQDYLEEKADNERDEERCR